MYDVNLSWEADPALLIADGYDLWKITKDAVPITAITNAWPPIVADVHDYRYRVSDTLIPGAYLAYPYRSSDAATGASVAVTATLGGYCTIADIRAQGYLIGAYPDATVQGAIQKASRLIEKITRQWFEPRFHFAVMDGKKLDTIPLRVPIIALLKVEQDLEIVDNSEFVIYNRHLRDGIVNPDDRADPRVSWGEGRNGVDIRRLYGGGRFAQARQSVKLNGYFGYTDIGAGLVGETAAGSQVPLSYGEIPPDIIEACTRLTLSKMMPFSDGDDMGKAGRVVSEKTRDQSYTLGTPSESDSSFGLTGDIYVDKILMMYGAPMNVGVV